MLVLSRKQDEEIIIGDNIRIRVLKVKGNTIRLGIDAPQDVKIMRGELTPVEVVLANDEGDSACESESDAEVTIVFSNDAPIRKNRLAVIPFSNAMSENTPADSLRQPITPQSQTTPSSISFRTQLPKTLQHNRLKAMVKDLTRGN